MAARRRRGFTASLVLWGFTPYSQRELQLPGLLVHGPSEIHGWCALRSVWSFPSAKASGVLGGVPAPAGFSAGTMTAADFSLRPAASPFQAQGEISPGKDGGVPRTVAGSTSLALGRKSSRSIVRFPWLTPPHIRRTPRPGGGASCSSTRGFCSPLLSAPASRPDRSPGFFALRFARGRCDQLPPGFSPVHHLHAGHTTKPLRGSPPPYRDRHDRAVGGPRPRPPVREPGAVPNSLHPAPETGGGKEESTYGRASGSDGGRSVPAG